MKADLLNETLEILDNYPHIRKSVVQYWNDTELLVLYLSSLLKETRENTRQGFPREVARQLVMLHNYFAEDTDCIVYW